MFGFNPQPDEYKESLNRSSFLACALYHLLNLSLFALAPLKSSLNTKVSLQKMAVYPF
ncbi:hypothetical protein K469DRAFT_381125 [Zopfia rhizophila CBS 207.26]|uniref:Uncharacterized protein n=1 Tax=Zopfia rhizophila CBS 207.26 TaxID=1314779 RepID=A0A6A6DFS7_9PEZI|nr:hypothetical protein K469DRAFT_381125 [Zopfia rhizophila CBS 207.26]